LTAAQVPLAVNQLIEEQIPAQAKAAFLTALANKGETAEEILGFARELRSLAIQPPLAPETRAGEILDVCGTGGDRLNTFNISTTVAIICAAGGIAVAKHGNRAITSQAGSADVLEALGIRINLTPEDAAASLRDYDFAFFFAPNYHPAFRHIGPARKLCAERGQRTIFNFLGPLLNPARPTVQLIGVPRPELCDPVARVLQALGIRRGLVVSGSIGPASDGATDRCLDEFSTLGSNTIAEFYHEHGLSQSELNPKLFAVQSATLDDLAGSDREANAEIVRRILRGEDHGPKREAVLLNTAAALFVANSADSMAEGWAFAAELIDTGAAYRKLQELAEASTV
jgi:anthranilate phosphoribosyltransferase